MDPPPTAKSTVATPTTAQPLPTQIPTDAHVTTEPESSKRTEPESSSKPVRPGSKHTEPELSSKPTRPESESKPAKPESSSNPDEPESSLEPTGPESRSKPIEPESKPARPESSSNPIEPIGPESWFTYIFEHEKASTKLPVMYSAPKHMTSTHRDNDMFMLDRKNVNSVDPVFDPFVVSIGPIGRKTPPRIDDRKNRIVFSMLKRHGNPDKRELLRELVDAVRTVQPDPRGSYFETFPDEEFFQTMVIDGCVILEIFRTHKGLSPELEGHPFFRSRWTFPAVALDFVKLENQLPYEVLKVLYKKTKKPEEPTLKQLAAPFLNLMCPGLTRETIEDEKPQAHLLSLFHSMCISNRNHSYVPVNGEEHRFNSSNSFPSAADLCLCGIKVVKKQQWKKLLEIEYKNGKLEIPTLVIDHNTAIFMRNMVAYEQSNKDVSDIFTSYVTFVGALVNSAEDVEVLRVAGVINHFMSSNEEVSVLLNSLTTNVKLDMTQGYLADLNAEIYRDHRSASTGPKTRFKRHLSSREGKSYLIAYVGAGLALVQIFLAILPYVLPPQKS